MTSTQEFHLGDWQVVPLEGRLIRDGESVGVRPKSMDVLLCLAAANGQVVEREALLNEVWGRAPMTDEPLTHCIAELRRALGDSRTAPTYIQTIPKRGYRLLQEVVRKGADADPIRTEREATDQVVTDESRLRLGSMLAAFIVTLLLVTAWFVIGPGQRPEKPPAASRNMPAIAVLPFANLSGDTDNSYLAEGIAEEILNALARIEGLRVTSRASAFALRERGLDVKRLAEELQVQYLLDGSVRKSGNSLRITAQLIDVDRDTQLWFQAFDKQTKDIFVIQREIATRVSEALRITLNLEQSERFADPGTAIAQAYEWYLRGREHLAKRTTYDLNAAAESFSRALEVDPSFARAQLGIADSYLLQTDYNDLPQAALLSKAETAANQALRLDSKLGEAYATLGAIRHEKRNYAGAERAFYQAMELAPYYSTTFHWFGYFLYDTAQQEDADRVFLAALDRDPLSQPIHYNRAGNLVAMGRFAEAENIYRELIAGDPEFANAFEGMAELHWRGRAKLATALEWYQRCLTLDPGSAYRHAMVAQINLDLGDADAAEHMLAKAHTIQPDSVAVRLHEALLRLFRGDAAQANTLALQTLDLEASNTMALFLARNHALRDNQLEEAKTHYARGFPDLFTPDPVLDRGNFQAAVDLALVFQRAGETERADMLMTKAEPLARQFPHHGVPRFSLSEVKTLALRGQRAQALAALERVLEDGWRAYWWVYLLHDPALDALRDDAQFGVLLDNLRTSIE